MSEQNYDEKEEKEVQKHEEKSMEEKWERDPVGTAIWALILIWAGIVLLANNFGLLQGFAFLETINMPEGFEFAQPGVWSLIFIGAGLLLFGEVLIRLLIPAYRRPVGGTIFVAIIFIGIGLGNITNWNIVWPLVLIGLGLSIVLRGLRKK